MEVTSLMNEKNDRSATFNFSRRLVEQIQLVDRTTSVIRERLQETTSAINQVINQIVQPLKISEVLKSLISPETLEKIRKGIIETEEDLILFKSEMVDMGYPPHYSISIDDIKRIAQQCREDRTVVEENLDEFMIRFFDHKQMHEIGYGWERRWFLQERLSTLRNIIKAYHLGMYELIPAVILGQSEGVIADGFGYKGRTDGTINNILLKNLLLEEVTSFSFDDEIYEYYNKRVLNGFEHGKAIKTDVSRHGFAHGGYKGSISQEAALKTILLFDYISERVEELTKEQKDKALREIREELKKRGERKSKNKRR